MSFKRHPKVGSEWGQCSNCSFDKPVGQIRFHPRWGWQCNDCWDGAVDRDLQRAQHNFRSGEGTRESVVPITNTETEGID